jgi:hypothetical protein
MTDLSTTIAPKSDQLNADDLITGPRTITITRVRGCSEPDQPVAVHFEGDDNKPYKPCKSMRRVLVFAWGPNGADYVGRSMTLYRDERVQFGGIQVGGIRISHMSHLERDMTMALTATRAKRTPYTVKALAGPATAQRSEIGTRSELPLGQRADAYAARIASAPNLVKLNAIKAAAAQLNADLEHEDPALLEALDQAWRAKADELRASESEAQR